MNEQERIEALGRATDKMELIANGDRANSWPWRPGERRRMREAREMMVEPPGDTEQALRKLFPHGHLSFLPITLREIKLHSEKNHDYAKGGPALGNFDRVAAILSIYPNLKLSDRRVVALVYALKQLDAVLWGISEQIEHKVEGLNARLQDISVYSKLVMCMNEDGARA